MTFSQLSPGVENQVILSGYRILHHLLFTFLKRTGTSEEEDRFDIVVGKIEEVVLGNNTSIIVSTNYK